MPTVTTPLGSVEGTEHQGCLRFAGIRYAKAPVGDLRFRAPVPVEPWAGTYEAKAFGPSSYQPDSQLTVLGDRGGSRSEDCLFLNVFTPATDDQLRPVMVWIHGGAYTMGSGDVYDGASFCERGDVVVVTINYRLGALGWLSVDHFDPALAGSANNGLRDQICALEWVRDNITAFGGDPGNVTIFGESAGGGSVYALLASEAAEGLFHRAIPQSGPATFIRKSRPEATAQKILAALGKPDGGLEALRAATPAQLVEAQSTLAAIGASKGGVDIGAFTGEGGGFNPTIDGVVLTRTVPEALAARGAANVPLLTGTNRDEGTLFALMLPSNLSDEDLIAGLRTVAPDPARLVAAYNELARQSGRTPLVELFGDVVFRISTLLAADAQTKAGSPAYVYLFTWPTPAFGGILGATHALEIPFVWNQVRAPGWSQFVGPDAPVDLALAMHDAWIAFARTGDPNHAGMPEWPRYDAERRPTLELNDTIKVIDDPLAEQRIAWI